MNDFNENQRRINRKISSATSALMSNTKWLKLLTKIEGLAFGLQWKFVNCDRVYTAQIPPLLKDTFGDGLPYPYGPYREIEWLLIPSQYDHPQNDKNRPLPYKRNNLEHIEKAINGLGQFPSEHSQYGLKILGYKWQ